jgi:hypothetical protein
VLLESGDMLDQPGAPVVRETDTEVPYWRFMNEDAISEINELDPDLAVIKGDIADVGRADQFEAAARAFAGFRMPHHAFLGNHDYYGLLVGEPVDGYALLGQPRARSLGSGGWRLVLLETAEPVNTTASSPTTACIGSPRSSRRRASGASPRSCRCTTTPCRPSTPTAIRTRSGSIRCTRCGSSI